MRMFRDNLSISNEISMHLEHTYHFMFLNYGFPSSFSDFSILARFSLSNAILFLLVINPSIYSEADDSDDDKGRLTRRKWCPWSSWSPCSPTKCFSGRVRQNPPFWPGPEEFPVEDDQITQCVLPSSNSSRKPSRAYVQQIIRGHSKVVVAAKQRFRTCDCPSVSLLNVFLLVSRHECFSGDTVFECNECGPDEKIYFSRNKNSLIDPIPYCSFDHSARFLLKQIWDSRRTIDRNVGGSVYVGNVSTRNGRGRNRSSHLQNTTRDDASEYLNNHHNSSGYPVGTGNMDLPPAYTDVVKLSGIETNSNTTDSTLIADRSTYEWLQNEAQIINLSSLSKSSPNHIHRFNCALDDSEQNATSSQILTVKPSNTPPPPSYEEIIAASVVINSQSGNNNLIP
ncbi:unnamed protein product [Heterobilharzia americana]|nr:unnamed protein product [Heterobilharzia americana]